MDWHPKRCIQYSPQNNHNRRQFPHISPVPSIVNKVIAGFLRAHMNYKIKHLFGATDLEDGIGIINRLQQLFAPATPEDRMNVLEKYNIERMTDRQTEKVRKI